MRALSKEEFLKGWRGLLFLFPHLHPDNALDHGDQQETWSEARSILPNLEKSSDRRYARSGWPVALELIGLEAWRRYKIKELNQEELYCAESQRAGLKYLSTLSQSVRTA